MAYDPRAIGNAYLKRSFADRKPVYPMKLQKLVYFSHGYYLAASELKGQGECENLVNEFFEAWDYGPVLPTLYHEFKHFGRGKITELAKCFDLEFQAEIVIPEPEDDKLFDSVSNYVWKTYAGRSSILLSNLTHRKKGAWDRARKDAKGIRGKDIPNEYILEDFKSLVRPAHES